MGLGWIAPARADDSWLRRIREDKMSLLLPRRAFLKAAVLAAPALWLPSREIVRPAAAQIPGMRTALGQNISAFFATDFREYATGAQPGDWTKRGATTTETWLISADASSVGGRIMTCTPGAANTGISFDRCGTSITDGDAFGIVKTGASASQPPSTYNHGVCIRGQTATDLGYYAALGVDGAVNSGNKSIVIAKAGVAVIASATFAWNANTVYAIRFRIQGTTLSAKAWAWPGAESGATSVSVTDATYASGYAGFFAATNAVTSQGTEQFFSFAPGADAAPYPSG